MRVASHAVHLAHRRAVNNPEGDDSCVEGRCCASLEPFRGLTAPQPLEPAEALQPSRGRLRTILQALQERDECRASSATFGGCRAVGPVLGLGLIVSALHDNVDFEQLCRKVNDSEGVQVIQARSGEIRPRVRYRRCLRLSGGELWEKKAVGKKHCSLG